jgi:hypothetical protein
MKMRVLFAIALLSICSLGKAQSTNTYFLEMDADVKPTVPTEKEKKESAYYVVSELLYEYAFDTKGQDLQLYYNQHVRVHLNDESGVEGFNTIELPAFDEKDFSIKARTILPNGTVKNLDNSNIKDKVDEQSGNKTKIFAYEGLSPGCEIEYILSVRTPTRLQDRDYMQSSLPSRIVKWTLLAPKNLVFEAKGYNGFKDISIDTIDEKLRRLYAEQENLAGISEEKYSNRKNYLLRIDYQFKRNTNSSTFDVRTWDDFAENIAENYRTKNQDISRIMQYLSKEKEYKKLEGLEAKVIWIENHIKTKFTASREADEQTGEDIYYILKNKVTTERGLNILTTAFLKAADIKHEIWFTTSRDDCYFDKDLVSAINLREMLIYIVDLKQFIKPDYIFYRYPILPSSFQSNYALKAVRYGSEGKMIVLAEIDKVPVQAANYNNHDIEATINLNLEDASAKVDMKHKMYGVSATGIRPALIFAEKDKQAEILKEIMSLGRTTDKFENLKAENMDYSSATNNVPLVLSCNITSDEIIEKAGADYIIHVGKVIGTQVEMYQEKERKTDIDIDFAHHLKRNITLQIPKGYKVKGIEKLNLDVKQGKSGERYGFISKATQAGNTITVDVDEWYCELFTPRSEIKQFVDVINAAADFEKSVVVLEKE